MKRSARSLLAIIVLATVCIDSSAAPVEFDVSVWPAARLNAHQGEVYINERPRLGCLRSSENQVLDEEIGEAGLILTRLCNRWIAVIKTKASKAGRYVERFVVAHELFHLLAQIDVLKVPIQYMLAGFSPSQSSIDRLKEVFAYGRHRLADACSLRSWLLNDEANHALLARVAFEWPAEYYAYLHLKNRMGLTLPEYLELRVALGDSDLYVPGVLLGMILDDHLGKEFSLRRPASGIEWLDRLALLCGSDNISLNEGANTTLRSWRFP
ncbi:MAG: hypothetical protein JNJ71_07375 [Rubrivivax sp.]|nr:hypothetical protein [Rubrivivax sp.]